MPALLDVNVQLYGLGIIVRRHTGWVELNARGLGHGIRALRHRRGHTQVELARRAGVSQPWISRLERGHPGAALSLVLEVIGTLDAGASVSPVPKGDGPGLDEWLERFG